MKLKIQTLSRFTCGYLALISLLAIPAMAADTLAKIKANGSITIAHRESSVPFSYLDADKQPIGYTLDICSRVVDAVRKELKLNKLDVKYLLVKPADRISTIRDGKADLECGNTTNNPDRRKEVAFAIPTFVDGAKLMSKGTVPLTGLSDISGRTIVTIEKGTSEKMLLEHNKKMNARITILATKDHKESFDALAGGKADAWMMDGILLASARAQSAKPSDYVISHRFLTVEALAIMLAKDDPAFAEVVNKEIRRLMQSGEIYKIYNKWFSKPIPPKGINLEINVSTLLKSFIDAPSTELPANF